LLIPANKVASFNRNLANVPQENRVSWTRHVVRSGDSLNSIAHRYFTTVKLIRELNQLKSDKLKNGQYVLIPSTKNAPVSTSKPTMLALADKPATVQTYKVIHIVQAGDTFQLLEKKYSTTAANIRTWNKLKPSQSLAKGEQLIIWKQSITPGSYTVVAGDNLSSIARRNNTTTLSLERLNPSLNTKLLKPGQKLLIG